MLATNLPILIAIITIVSSVTIDGPIATTGGYFSSVPGSSNPIFYSDSDTLGMLTIQSGILAPSTSDFTTGGAIQADMHTLFESGGNRFLVVSSNTIFKNDRIRSYKVSLDYSTATLMGTTTRPSGGG